MIDWTLYVFTIIVIAAFWYVSRKDDRNYINKLKYSLEEKEDEFNKLVDKYMDLKNENIDMYVEIKTLKKELNKEHKNDGFICLTPFINDIKNKPKEEE